MGKYHQVQGLGHELWTCERCGSVVLKDTRDIHDMWHELVDAPLDAPRDDEEGMLD
jgi:hypothetical protein